MRLLLWLTIVVTNNIFAVEWKPSLGWYLYSRETRAPVLPRNRSTDDNSTIIIESSTITAKGRKLVLRPGDLRTSSGLPRLHVGQLVHKAPSRVVDDDEDVTFRLNKKDGRRVIWRGWRRVSGDVRLTPNSGRSGGRSEGRSGQKSQDMMHSMFMTSLRALQRTTMSTPLQLPDITKKVMEIPVGELLGEDSSEPS